MVSEWEPGPRIERDRVRVVLHEVRGLTEVVPRVVAAEVDLAFHSEIAIRLHARPEHEYHGSEEDRNVVPAFE